MTSFNNDYESEDDDPARFFVMKRIKKLKKLPIIPVREK